jgi:hypothetical protein
MEWNEIAPFEDQTHQPSIRGRWLCDSISNLDEKNHQSIGKYWRDHC